MTMGRPLDEEKYSSLSDTFGNQSMSLGTSNKTQQGFDKTRIKTRMPLTTSHDVEQDDTVYKCTHPGCEFMTKLPRTFTLHVLGHGRTESGRYECDQCGKSYRDKYSLGRHVRVSHNKEPILCECCSKPFKNIDALRLHYRIQNGQFTYKCSLCGKGFFHKQWFIGHLNKHKNEKPFQCELCGKSFSLKPSLRVHRLRCSSSTGKKKEKRTAHQCSTCGIVYPSNDMLREHITAKHSDKKYVCGCGEEFSWRSSYCRHKLTSKSCPFSQAFRGRDDVKDGESKGEGVQLE